MSLRVMKCDKCGELCLAGRGIKENCPCYICDDGKLVSTGETIRDDEQIFPK